MLHAGKKQTTHTNYDIHWLHFRPDLFKSNMAIDYKHEVHF